ETALATFKDGLHGVALSPDGRLLAVIAGILKVQLWETSPSRLRRELPKEADAGSVFFSPGGTLLACVIDTRVSLWLVADLRDDALGPALAEVRKFASVAKKGRGWRVELNEKADDAALEKLKALPGLVELRFGFVPKVTDAGLAHLKALPDLGPLRIGLWDMETGPALLHVRAQPELLRLGLATTQTTARPPPPPPPPQQRPRL